MKKIIHGIFVMLIALPVVFLVNAEKTEAAVNDMQKATWLWHTKDMIDKADEQLQFLAEQEATIIYLQVNRSIKASKYYTFIEKANALNIEVHALDGSSKWVRTSDQSSANKFFDWVEIYQNAAPDNAKFSGIHLDIEPYILKEWKTMYDQIVLNYQNLIIEAGQRAEAMGLPLNADIPFWFDKQFYNNSYGLGVLSEWIIDNTDAVTIMAYRDKAMGSNGIIALSRTEMEYAEKVGKSVSIAVETRKSSEGDYLSFYEENLEQMAQQLAIVENEFQDNTSFIGFSIHSIDHWMNME